MVQDLGFSLAAFPSIIAALPSKFLLSRMSRSEPLASQRPKRRLVGGGGGVPQTFHGLPTPPGYTTFMVVRRTCIWVPSNNSDGNENRRGDKAFLARGEGGEEFFCACPLLIFRIALNLPII